MKLTLFITGGCGFIGVNFVHYWRKHRPEDFIVNYDALTYAGCRKNQTAYEGQNNYRFIHGDILDRAFLTRIFSGSFEGVPKPDLIVHFAAETHVDRSIGDPAVFVRTNVLGTQTLLDVALSEKIPFHHISTDEVFGSLNADDPPFTENSPYRPRSPYAASKAASDHLVRAYGNTYGLPFVITNCSNNYGPHQFPEKFIALAITNLLQEKKVPVYGEGKNIRNWLFVEDHCEALERIIVQRMYGQAYDGATYCIGGNCEMSNIEVVRKILKIMGKDESWIEFVKNRPGHDFRYAMNTAKIEKELGWTPKTSFEDGLRNTIAWYLENEAGEPNK